MTQGTRVQQKFGGGELDPVLHERYDVQQYESSIGDSLNVMCTNKGELISRPGTEIVKPLDNTDDKTRIISFIVDNNNKFRLEFTDQTLKIYQGDTQITSNAKYTFDQNSYCPNAGTTSDGQKHWVGVNRSRDDFPFQVGDIFTIGTEESPSSLSISYNPGGIAVVEDTTQFEISSIGTAVKNQVSTFGEKFDAVVAPSTAGSGGNAQTDKALDYVEIYAAGASTTLNMVASSTVPSSLYWNFEKTSWATPYLEDELDEIQYASSGNDMYFVHPNYQPMRLRFYSGTDFTFAPHWTWNGPWKPDRTYGVKWNPISHSAWTAHQPIYNNWEPSNGAASSSGESINPNYLAGRYMRLTEHSSDSPYINSYALGQIVYANSTNGLIDNIRVLLVKPLTAINGYVLGGPSAYDMGFYTTTRNIGDSDLVKLGYLFEADPGDGSGGWPSAVEVFENRLFYGGNSSHPNTLACSQFGDFDDWSVDDDGVAGQNTTDVSSANNVAEPEIRATDGFTYTIGEIDTGGIVWMKATDKGLFIGTRNGIFRSSTRNANESLDALNYDFKLVSKDGSASIRPEFIDGRLYYVSTDQRKLFSIGYEIESDNYKSIEESIFSDHLFNGKITNIAHCRNPVQVLWIGLDSGRLVSLVFLESQSQKGFFKHRISGPSDDGTDKGYVYSMCSIPTDEGGLDTDQLHMAIVRPTTISESYVEKLSLYPMNRDTQLFNTLDIAMSPITDGNGAAVVTATRDNSGSVDNLYISPVNGLIATDNAAFAGFEGDNYEYLNSGNLETVDAVPGGTLLQFISTTSTPPGDGVTIQGDISYTGSGYIFRRAATYTNTVTRWTHGAPDVIEKGVLLSDGDGFTYTSASTITFDSNTGYIAFLGHAPDVYVTLLPDTRANQQGRGEAYLANISKLTFKIRNTRNFTVTRENGSLAIPLIKSPTTETVGALSNRYTGKFSIEPEQIQDDEDGVFRIDVERGYPLTLQSVYMRGERTSR